MHSSERRKIVSEGDDMSSSMMLTCVVSYLFDIADLPYLGVNRFEKLAWQKNLTCKTHTCKTKLHSKS